MAYDLWVNETLYDAWGQRFRVKRELARVQSAFQDIMIFESETHGRVMMLDGVVQITEADEFSYQEMIAHVPLLAHGDAKRVLIIGAGDGGVLRELARYPGIRHMDVVEIDRRVVEVCKQYLPQTACGFDDPRVHLRFEDGLRFVRHTRDRYDLIIVDSTDPSGPGEVLFTSEFYGGCSVALSESGILVNQHESPFYAADARAMQSAHKRIAASFPMCRVYQAHIPTDPSGHWLFGFASKGPHPVRGLQAARWQALGIATRYYNVNLHRGAFALPTYVEELLKRDE